MKQSFITYRDGAGPIETRIKAAVTTFYKARGVLPVGIVVNKVELDAAQEAVKALALRTPVRGNGGCLASEVWLEVAERSAQG